MQAKNGLGEILRCGGNDLHREMLPMDGDSQLWPFTLQLIEKDANFALVRIAESRRLGGWRLRGRRMPMTVAHAVAMEMCVRDNRPGRTVTVGWRQLVQPVAEQSDAAIVRGKTSGQQFSAKNQHRNAKNGTVAQMRIAR